MVPPQRWGEFTYPLERAREFAGISESWKAGARSLVEFRTACDRYGELASDPGILKEADAKERVRLGFGVFSAAVERVRTALEIEYR